MIAFLESVGSLLVAAHHARLRDRWMVKFVLERDKRFIPTNLHRRGPVFILSASALRWLRVIAGLAQLPVLQQSSISISYRLNRWKLLISDGLVTEYFIDRLGEPVGRFYSMQDVETESATLADTTAIIGSNWLEFGCMDRQAYLDHLTFLRERYPDAVYYCHPKEKNTLPEDVFGARNVGRPDGPVEMHLRRVGIPRRLVGVCSSSLLSLPATWPSHVGVDLIVLEDHSLNGPVGGIVQRMAPPLNGVSQLSVGDLQDYLRDALDERGVRITRVPQP